MYWYFTEIEYKIIQYSREMKMSLNFMKKSLNFSKNRPKMMEKSTQFSMIVLATFSH